MGNELNKIEVETHLIVGENDIIIPPEKSIRKAKKHLKNNLKNIQIFEGIEHGIELYYPIDRIHFIWLSLFYQNIFVAIITLSVAKVSICIN